MALANHYDVVKTFASYRANRYGWGDRRQARNFVVASPRNLGGEDDPRPYTTPELHAEVKLADLGKMRGVAGDVLHHYEMRPVAGGSEVQFSFESGRMIVFKNAADHTTYAG